MRHRHAAALIALASLSLLACDDRANGDPVLAYGGAACEAMAASCKVRSRGCVADEAGPSCRACPAGQHPTGDEASCTDIAGQTLHFDFGDATLAPGQEIGSLCQSWVLDNDEALYVNAVELANTGFYHHSNWFFVPEGFNDWPTEDWVDCYAEGFHEIDAALAGGVVYAQSTQARFELQKFQNGAVVRIPPRSRIIGATHLLNYTAQAQTTNLRMTLYTLPAEDVRIKLVPAQLIYTDLNIPAGQISYADGTCDLNAAHEQLFSRPLEAKLHYLLPHYHALGDSFSVEIVGGPLDGTQLVDLGSFTTDPYGFVFDPPIDLAGATGLSFSCGFDNPTDAVVHWGIGDQEMCEALIFMEAEMAFSASVGATEQIETVGGREHHSGTCSVAAFPFNPDK